MEFAPGAITLDDITGGTLQAGEVPNARLEAELTALADALMAGGIVPHANLTGELVTLANALTAGGIVPHANLTGQLVTLANALTAGGVVPHANLTGHLVTLANALLSGGLAPWQNILRGSYREDNAGNVVLVAGGTAVIGVGIGTLAVGDLVLVSGQIHVVKAGAGAGEINVDIQKTAGTSILRFFSGAHAFVVQDSMNVALGDQADVNLTALCYCLQAGTCTLMLSGSSQNGNSTVLAGQGLIAAWVLPNA